jgi:hypothetical protein
MWPMWPVTRRSFVWSLLITPLTCAGLGCGGDAVSVNVKAGEKRRRSWEERRKNADLKRESRAEKAPSR